MPPSFVVLGYHRGKSFLHPYGQHVAGVCGSHDPRTGEWEEWPTELGGGQPPLTFVAAASIGPLWVRKAAFDGFNTSYSSRGSYGVGFDFEFVARTWARGLQAAVACPSVSLISRTSHAMPARL